MADLFVLTARRLLQDLPDAHFIVPTASRATREMFEMALRRHEAMNLPLTLMFGHSHERSRQPTSRWWRAAPPRSRPRCSRRRW
jgi:lipid A disaccharide synthetase